MSESPQNTRREFLAGQSARDALAALIDQRIGLHTDDSADTSAAAQKVPEEFLLKYSRRAMACQFEFTIPAGVYPQDAETALAALDLVDELESQLTVYRPTSELMAINRMAYGGRVPVEPRLFRLLEFALQVSEITDGAYDITAGPLTQCWGFHRREGRVPSQEEIADALSRVGSRHVELDPQTLTARFRTSRVELNLGSVGKGYALDRCAELLRSAGIGRALLHGGQSSVVAIGGRKTAALPTIDQPGCESTSRATTSAGPRVDEVSPPAAPPTPASAGWQIGVGDPLRPGRRLAIVNLEERALGTSGSSVQFFRHAGRRYGHILDPRTGWPAEGLLSATVIASTAAEADAYSTACYVLGLEGALRLCETAGLAAALVELPGTQGRPKLHTHGLGSADFCLVSDETA